MLSARFIGMALVATSGLWTFAPQHAVGADDADVCEGQVFLDVDQDGADDGEPGIVAARLVITDAAGRETAVTTEADGSWSVDADRVAWPIAIHFETPAGLQPSQLGPDSASAEQFLRVPADCGRLGLGSFAVFEPGAACRPDAPIVAGCYVFGDADDHAQRPALQIVDADMVDDGDTDGDEQPDWLDPAPTTIATQQEIGAVYGLATDHRGVVYAAAFVKRHATLRTELNPTGNPTTIYRIVPGRAPEVFVTLDPDATDPHGDLTPGDYRDDPHVFDDVFTTGIGDIEITPDGATLYAVDLGRRELVTVSTTHADVIGRTPLDGAALGIDSCGVDGDRPFGDLRPFGLGFDADGDLLVGVVCSAASTVPPDTAIGRHEDAPLGDAGTLVGYVYEHDDGFVRRLAWPLDHDRGDTQDNQLMSNDARWRPWVDAVPFADEYDAVSYPQPAISDIAIDHDGSMIVALADRWGHQTGPDTTAPTVTGERHRIVEPVSAGDLQRACPDGDGWVIEGSPGCPGGWGDGFEFFSGDRYGWHAETALGSVIAVTDDERARTTLIASQMDPLPRQEPWFSGGVAWHDSGSGDYLRGARLYDGRSADPDGTFEHAGGITDLALLCDAEPLEIGGRLWHDLDDDGTQDPGEPPIHGLRMELRRPDGELITTTDSDRNGHYVFTAEPHRGALENGDEYLVTVADWNTTDGPFSAGGATPGLRPTAHAAGSPTLDSDGRVGGDFLPQAGLTYARVVAGDDLATAAREPGVDHTIDFGFRNQYDVAVATRWVRHDDVLGLLAFEITVHNQGSEPSGLVRVLHRMPAGTELVAATRGGVEEPERRQITWTLPSDDDLAPGEVRVLTVLVHVADDSRSPYTSTVEIVADSGDDDDSTPGNADFAPVIDRDELFRPDGTLIDDNGGFGFEDDADVALVHLHQISGRVWIDPDRDGDYEPDDDVADPTLIEEPAAGVAVLLHHADGTEIERQWTTHDGSYEFTMVPSGPYTVSIPAAEFASEQVLHGYDWMRSAYRTGGFDPADGLQVPLTLRPGSDQLAQVDIAVAGRPTRSWGWLASPQLTLPLLVLVVFGFLLVQRRSNRAALLAA